VRDVLPHIQGSLAKKPRLVTIISKNPRSNDLLLDCGFRGLAEFIDAEHPFVTIVLCSYILPLIPFGVHTQRLAAFPARGASARIQR